MTLDQQSVH